MIEYRKIIVAVAALAATLTLKAEKQYLWPEGAMPDAQTHQIAAMTDVAQAEGFDPALWRESYLEWYAPPEHPNGGCAVLMSGGSYNKCCDVGLVATWRKEMTKIGFQCVNLVYRTPRPEGLAIYRSAWEDGQRAIRIVRSEAAARGLDPDQIGIMGSSAGGHLALLAATSSQTDSYPPIDEIDGISPSVQWAICVYPAYALTDGLRRQNLHGGNEEGDTLAPEFVFDGVTPPMLFLHGDGDGWAAMNSVMAWEKLRRMGIQSELHTLVKRGHCFQRKASPGTASYNFLERIGEFLKKRKIDFPY